MATPLEPQSVSPTISDTSSPVSNEDLPYYTALTAQFGDVESEDFCVRVAQAYSNEKRLRMQKTLAEAKRIHEWREKWQVNSILQKELPNSSTFFDCWPGYVYGEDNEGHLVTMDRIQDIQLEQFQQNFNDIDALVPHRAQYMERIAWEKAAISKRLGRNVYKHIGIIDLKGLGIKHLTKWVISYLKPIFDVGQLYYPETLHRLYILNTSLVFYGVWKVISAIIDADTREKIQLFKSESDFLAAAQKQGIPLTSLPIAIGGEHPGIKMDNTFVASDPTAIYPMTYMKKVSKMI